MYRPLWIGAALAVALAALSLALPYQPLYDPWGWLVWGRELVRLDLATGAGPSWKPLPALVDAPFSLLGDSAPQAWLLLARSGSLLAPLFAGWLAATLTGAEAGRWRYAAAALAAASVALMGDAFTPPTRQFTGGLSEPLLVALVLGAVIAVLDRRPALALWLGVGASLLRPECWPFLALWALLAVRVEPRLHPQAVAAAILIPLAWFLPDLLAAGSPLEGPETARQGGIELDELAQVAGRAVAAPLTGAWIGVGLLLVLWRRAAVTGSTVASRPASGAGERAMGNPAGDGTADRGLGILLIGAGAWICLVAAMAVVGFAGLPRFLAPASAAISIVGAVGIARAGASGFTGDWQRSDFAAAALIALAVAAAGFAIRIAALSGDVETIERQTDSQNDLFRLADRVGADRLLSCGGTVRVTQLLAQTALAWKLDEPIASVRVIRRPRYGVALSTRPLPGGRVIARVGSWRASRLPC